MHPSTITMRAVALAAGVNQSTVSRALRDDPRISASRRAEIQKVADQLGYRPEPHLTELMEKLRRPPVGVCEQIAMLHDFAPDESIRLESVERFRAWMDEAASQLGFGVEVFAWHTYKQSWTNIARVLRARGIRGVIVCPFYRRDIRHWDFPWEAFSVVAIGSCPDRPAFHRVDTDDFGDTRLILRSLQATGFQRIGFILDRAFHEHVRGATLGAFLAWQFENPTLPQLPVAVIESNKLCLPDLDRWFSKWKPDILLPSCVQKLIRPWLDAQPCDFVRLNAGPGEWGMTRESHRAMVENALIVVTRKIRARDLGLPKNEIVTSEGLRWVPPPSQSVASVE